MFFIRPNICFSSMDGSTMSLCGAGLVEFSDDKSSCTDFTDSTSSTPPRTVLECDYDKNPTSLYQAIENEAWGSILKFLRTGKWGSGLFDWTVYSQEETIPPEVQARTWVRRYLRSGDDKRGSIRIRWSQLPLHASIAYGAPPVIIEKLLNLYPPAVYCSDDQDMLPLHLALYYKAADKTVSLLVEQFPESATSTATLRAAGVYYRPTSQYHDSEIHETHLNDDRSKIIKAFVENTTKAVLENRNNDKIEVECQRLVGELNDKIKILDDQIKNMDDAQQQLYSEQIAKYEKRKAGRKHRLIWGPSRKWGKFKDKNSTECPTGTKENSGTAKARSSVRRWSGRKKKLCKQIQQQSPCLNDSINRLSSF